MNLNELPIIPEPPANVHFGVQIVYSEHAVTREQFRVPRSKKRRIRAKWAKRSCNWRLVPRIYRSGNTVYAHPAWKEELEAMAKSLSQVVGNVNKDYPYAKREMMYFKIEL